MATQYLKCLEKARRGIKQGRWDSAKNLNKNTKAHMGEGFQALGAHHELCQH